MKSASGVALAVLVITVVIISNIGYGEGCYSAMFAFGDSLTDPGNLLVLNSRPDYIPHMGLLPNGETFFHGPTGRCSDGRIIVDFIAEHFGLPLAPAYMGVKYRNMRDGRKGMNFAVAGAMTVNNTFYEERGIVNPITNATLNVQFSWFKDYLSTLCDNASECRKIVGSSLFVIGAFGGNDYRYSLALGKNLSASLSYVPIVLDTIAQVIEELIEMGAKTIVVPGLQPDGCIPYDLVVFKSGKASDYDPSTGCLTWLNRVSEYHNQKLQERLSQLRTTYKGRVSIIYADYYNATMRLYLSPAKFGFTCTNCLEACCGVGGPPYNYSPNQQCGDPGTSGCARPSDFINWDGCHPTDAANQLIAEGLLLGPYTTPHISTSCISSINSKRFSTY